MTRPLRSTPITGASPLLRDGPPLCSVTGTQPLAALHHLRLSLSPRSNTRGHFRNDRFPRSERKPGPSSRHLHAGHRLGSKQVSPRLIPKTRSALGSDVICYFRHFSSGSLTLVFLVHTWRAHGAPFPHRFPPRLLTGAVCGGFKPSPARRLQRAYLHLPPSYTLQQNPIDIGSPFCARGTRS
jgi:hypothetical protein